jgi:hypothetical protein
MTQTRQEADQMERDRRTHAHEKKFGRSKGEGWNDLTQRYDSPHKPTQDMMNHLNASFRTSMNPKSHEEYKASREAEARKVMGEGKKYGED